MSQQEQQDAMEHKLFLLAKDIGYNREALKFIFAGLQEAIKKPGVHVSGQELCLALKKVGMEWFGYLAKTVFASWGVHKTQDWGNIVFAMVDADMMGKQDEDTIGEFTDVFNFDELELDYKF